MTEPHAEYENLSRIPVAVLQRAFAASGLTAGQVAMRLEWYTHKNRPDSTRVKRALGLAASSDGIATEVSYKRAVKLIRAMDFDPVDYGL